MSHEAIVELRGSQASLSMFALLQTPSKVMDRHLYMELVVLSHFIPNFQAVHGGKEPVGAVSAWDTAVPCQTRQRSTWLCWWLRNGALGTAGSQPSLPLSCGRRFPPHPCSQHHQLCPCSSRTGSCVGTGILSWSWSGALGKCCCKLVRSYLRRAGGFISEDAAIPNLPTPHPHPAHRQDLPMPSSIAGCRRVFTLMEAGKGMGYCPVSACVTLKRVRSLDITKKEPTRG